MIKQTLSLIAFTLLAGLAHGIETLPAHLDIHQNELETMAADIPRPFRSFQCNSCSEEQLQQMVKKNAEMLDVYTFYTTCLLYTSPSPRDS